ncbi:MAG: cysteine--tRNA ligase [Thermodesulfobacteriota bacterium]
MPIRVYNSLTRNKEDFRPLSEGEVNMYVCGPTVYDLSHIGHARSAVAFDVVYRYLKYKGYRVKYVRNYTDIDDKIINRANKDGVTSKEIAEKYIKAFDEDMAALGVDLPDFRPKATKTIKDIVEFIEILIDKRYAYVVEKALSEKERNCDVYYSVRMFDGYGKLSGKDIDELEAGARVEVDEKKEDPLDFALWKASKAGEPYWESPWGKGRPGWHIECSAMSRKFLGDTIDIHGGGRDLIFPHHENEIAQSETATGKQFVRYWLHNGFVNIEEEKMSKSLGNILLIRDILKKFHYEVLRLFFLSSHYRSPVDYSERNLTDAEAALERVYLTLARIEKNRGQESGVMGQIDEKNLKGIEKDTYEKASNLLNSFEEAMDDDFNTAMAIGHLFDLVRMINRFMDDKIAARSANTPAILAVAKNGIEKMAEIFGIFSISPDEYLNVRKEQFLKEAGLSYSEIEGLISERDEAREQKDFKRADEIRIALDAKGISLEDTSKGTIWKTKN